MSISSHTKARCPLFRSLKTRIHCLAIKSCRFTYKTVVWFKQLGLESWYTYNITSFSSTTFGCGVKRRIAWTSRRLFTCSRLQNVRKNYRIKTKIHEVENSAACLPVVMLLHFLTSKITSIPHILDCENFRKCTLSLLAQHAVFCWENASLLSKITPLWYNMFYIIYFIAGNIIQTKLPRKVCNTHSALQFMH